MTRKVALSVMAWLFVCKKRFTPEIERTLYLGLAG
jgi:hypothetical protein